MSSVSTILVLGLDVPEGIGVVLAKDRRGDFTVDVLMVRAKVR